MKVGRKPRQPGPSRPAPPSYRLYPYQKAALRALAEREVIVVKCRQLGITQLTHEVAEIGLELAMELRNVPMAAYMLRVSNATKALAWEHHD